MKEDPKPYTGDLNPHSTADPGERLPTADERRAWRAKKSPSFPEYWKKKREERRTQARRR